MGIRIKNIHQDFLVQRDKDRIITIIRTLIHMYKGLLFSIRHDECMNKDDYLISTEAIKCEAKIEVLQEILYEIEKGKI